MTVSPGKVEIGQGIVTALAQIAADELDIDISRVQMVRASTAASPNEGVTSGSLSVQQSGRAMRHACAEVRQIFLQLASERLGVAIDALDVEDGTISGPGNVTTSYWELAEEVSLDRDATPDVKPKLGRAGRWPETPCSGSTFPTRCSRSRASSTIGRCRKCCMAGCCGRKTRARNSSGLREDGARAIAGLVAVVRDGSFAGVVSETEHGAEAALKPCARARPGPTARPCPTKTIWLRS